MREFPCRSVTLENECSAHLEAVNRADFYVGPEPRCCLVLCLAAVAFFCSAASQASCLDQLLQQLNLAAVGRDDSHSHAQCRVACMRLCS